MVTTAQATNNTSVPHEVEMKFFSSSLI